MSEFSYTLDVPKTCQLMILYHKEQLKTNMEQCNY